MAQTPAPTGLAAIVKGSLGATVQKVLTADNKTANAWADDLGKSGLATPDLSAKQKELLTTFVADVADYKACLARAYHLLPLQEPDRDDKLKGQGHGDNTPWDDADAAFRRIIAAESAAETANSPDFFGSTAFQNYRVALFAKADALINLRDLMTLAGDAAGNRKALEDYEAGAGILSVSKELGAKFSVIGDAVKAAEAGSLILIGEGTYPEEVSVTKPLTLYGLTYSSKCIIEPKQGEGSHQDDECLHIRTSYAEVTSLNLQEHNYLSYAVDNGAKHASLNYCLVSGGIEQSGGLIHQEPHSSLRVDHCSLVNMGKGSGNRQFAWDETSTFIADKTTFRIDGDQILIFSGSGMRGCDIQRPTSVMVSGNGVITDTSILGNVYLWDGSPLLQNCTVKEGNFRVETQVHATLVDDVISGEPIKLLTGSNTTIEKCSIVSNNSEALHMRTGAGLKIIQSKIQGSREDIDVPFGESQPQVPQGHLYNFSLTTAHEPGENDNTTSLGQNFFEKAVDAEKHHQYGDAENYLRHSLRLWDDLGPSYRVLARVQSTEGKNSEAINTLKKWLLQNTPEDVEADGIVNRVMLVDLLLKSGRRAEALAAAKEAISYKQATEDPNGQAPNEDYSKRRNLSQYHSFQVLGLFPMKQSATIPHALKRP